MTSSTTLMTFLVRTPPTTRSVSLYGSWDNFAVPYPMQRDTRLGSEHWSGCHSFDNIICDGRLDKLKGARHGGLKMGGTYWYYYELDDGIEFHNSAEPSTTACPLLPGQLVNVLQVPMALGRSHGRDASVDSINSERWTLNPADKFLNPRPSPTPPPLMRVNTSPTSSQYLFSAASSPTSTSQPSLSRCSSRDNLSVPPMHRLLHKTSLDAFSRGGNNSSKSAGLRQAFRTLRTGRSPSPETRYKNIMEWTPSQTNKTSISAPQTPELVCEAASYFEPMRPAEAGSQTRSLLLRTTSETGIPTTSFLEHRRERSRSRSREQTSLRNAMVIDEDERLNLETPLAQRGQLDTVVEVTSPQELIRTSTAVSKANQSTPTRQPSSPDFASHLEKRLPTLPNTPSSAYPPSAGGSPERRFSKQIECLQSRFSATTINTQYERNSTIFGNTSRFSDWSTTSDLISPASDSTADDSIASPTTELDDFGTVIRPITTNSPELVYAPSSDGIATPRMFPSHTCTASNSAASTVPSTAYGCETIQGTYRLSLADDVPPHVTNQSRYQHYSLPGTENGSEVTLKSFGATGCSSPMTPPGAAQLRVRDQNMSLQDRRNGFPHSESMQQLMDELSYLSDVIVQH